MDPYPNQPNPRNSQGQLGNPGFPNKTQGLATPTKIFFLEPSNWGALFRNSSNHKPLCFPRNKHQPKQDSVLRHSIRVEFGKSRVHHGLVTGFPRVSVSQSQGFSQIMSQVSQVPSAAWSAGHHIAVPLCRDHEIGMDP